MMKDEIIEICSNNVVIRLWFGCDASLFQAVIELAKFINNVWKGA